MYSTFETIKIILKNVLIDIQAINLSLIRLNSIFGLPSWKNFNLLLFLIYFLYKYMLLLMENPFYKNALYPLRNLRKCKYMFMYDICINTFIYKFCYTFIHKKIYCKTQHQSSIFSSQKPLSKPLNRFLFYQHSLF